MRKIIIKASMVLVLVISLFFVSAKFNATDAKEIETTDSINNALTLTKEINSEIEEVEIYYLYDIDANEIGYLIEPDSLEQYYIYIESYNTITEYSLKNSSPYTQSSIESEIFIYGGLGQYYLYLNNQIYDLLNDKYIELTQDNFNQDYSNVLNYLFPTDDELYTDETIKITEKRITNSWYFENNTSELPDNVDETCGYVTLAMLLAYYDFFYNDYIVDEDFIFNKIRNDQSISDKMIDLYIADNEGCSVETAYEVLLGEDARLINKPDFWGVDVKRTEEVPGATETLHYLLQYVGSLFGYGSSLWSSKINDITERYFNIFADEDLVGDGNWLYGHHNQELLGASTSQIDKNNPMYICIGNARISSLGQSYNITNHIVLIYGYQKVKRSIDSNESTYYIGHLGWKDSGDSEVYFDCSTIGSSGYILNDFPYMINDPSMVIMHSEPDGINICETEVNSSYELEEYYTYDGSNVLIDYYICNKCGKRISISHRPDYRPIDENTHEMYNANSNEVITTYNHDFEYVYSNNNDTHYYKCKDCGFIKEEEHHIDSYDDYGFARCEDCYYGVVDVERFKSIPSPKYVNLYDDPTFYKISSNVKQKYFFFTTSTDASIYLVSSSGVEKVDVETNANGTYYEFTINANKETYIAVTTPGVEYVRVGFTTDDTVSLKYVSGSDEYIRRGNYVGFYLVSNGNQIPSDTITYKTTYSEINDFSVNINNDNMYITAYWDAIIDDKITIYYYKEGVCLEFSKTFYVVEGLYVETETDSDGQIFVTISGLNEGETATVECEAFNSDTGYSIGTFTYDLGKCYHYDYDDGDIGEENSGSFYILDVLPTLKNLYLQTINVKIISVTMTTTKSNVTGTDISYNDTYKSFHSGEIFNSNIFSLRVLFSSGTGTSESPYSISSMRQLNNIRYMEKDGIITGYYKLTQNISGYTYGINGDNYSWTPITKFNGTFDGNNKTIYYIRFRETSILDDYYGLFGINRGTITKLRIENVDIEISSSQNHTVYVGAIAGMNEGNINNCYVAGNMVSVSNDIIMGSIAGMNVNAYVENSVSYINMTTKGTTGGIVGFDGSWKDPAAVYYCNYYGTINYSHTGVNSDSDNASIGGVVGKSVMDVVYYSGFYGTIKYTGSKNSNTDLAPRMGQIYGTLGENYEGRGYCSGTVDEGSLRTFTSWFKKYKQRKYVSTDAVGKIG